MSALEKSVVRAFLDGFELCKAVEATGNFRADEDAICFRMPEASRLPARCFAVPPAPDDRHVDFGPLEEPREIWEQERSRYSLVFAPFSGEFEAGQIYLWGFYDRFHRLLDGATVQRLAGVTARKLFWDDRGDEEPSAYNRSECVIVGRFIGTTRDRDLGEIFGERATVREWRGNVPVRPPGIRELRLEPTRPRREDFRVIEGHTLAA